MFRCRYQLPPGQEPPTQEEETTNSQRNAIFWTLLAIVIFLSAVYVSNKWEQEILKVNWSVVTGLCGGAFFAFMIYRWATEYNSFDPMDLFMDPVTRRISPWRTTFNILFAMAMWTLGSWVLGDKPAQDIISLIQWVGVGLVAKLASGEWADVVAKRDPIPAPEPPLQGEPK